MATQSYFPQPPLVEDSPANIIDAMRRIVPAASPIDAARWAVLSVLLHDPASAARFADKLEAHDFCDRVQRVFARSAASGVAWFTAADPEAIRSACRRHHIPDSAVDSVFAVCDRVSFAFNLRRLAAWAWPVLRGAA